MEHITYDDLDIVWEEDDEEYPKDSVFTQEIEQETWDEIGRIHQERRLNQEIFDEVHKK